MTISLASYFDKTGRREEARDVGRNLGWFGEGFDTADLRDAQAPERELVA